ncbi:MAG: ATP-binding protein [Candidatus Natronoplasma sp.]
MFYSDISSSTKKDERTTRILMMFIDRSKEMNSLQKRYISDDFQFVVINGRRRIGKTELIKQFSKDKLHIYFLLPQDTEDIQIS